MRRYETIFILRANTGEEDIKRVIDYTSDIIAKANGTIIELNQWGMKKLAYLIKKESLGYYVFVDFACEPEAIAEIERRFRIDDAVIKYMTVKVDDEIDSAGAQEAIVAVSQRVERADDEDADEFDGDDDSADDDDDSEE